MLLFGAKVVVLKIRSLELDEEKVEVEFKKGNGLVDTSILDDGIFILLDRISEEVSVGEELLQIDKLES